MNEMIIYKDENPILNPETARLFADYERRMKELKEQEEIIKEAILKEMEAKGVIKLESEEIKISYIAPTDRETFDSKKFRSDNPDLYDEYVKITPVKASLRVKVN